MPPKAPFLLRDELGRIAFDHDRMFVYDLAVKLGKDEYEIGAWPYSRLVMWKAYVTAKAALYSKESKGGKDQLVEVW